MKRVLILCTGNSARSILGGAILNDEAHDAAFDLAYARLRLRLERMLVISPDTSSGQMRQALRPINVQVRAAGTAHA